MVDMPIADQNNAQPTDQTTDSNYGLDYTPQTPVSTETMPVSEGGSSELEATSEKAPEVQRVPETLGVTPKDQASSDVVPDVVSVAPTTATDTPANVVDMRTGDEELEEVKSSHPLTAHADDEEEEFIEGVEHCHDTGKTQ